MVIDSESEWWIDGLKGPWLRVGIDLWLGPGKNDKHRLLKVAMGPKTARPAGGSPMSTDANRILMRFAKDQRPGRDRG